MSPMVKPKRTLTPVDVTRRSPAFRSGRVETWAAVSSDGTWKYERLEIAGTPWSVVHVPTGVEGDWYSTLTAAREATADGTALAAVERIQAHERGEHDTERDTQCIKC